MKLNFALEQTDQHQEAAAAAKAGTAVTFAAGDLSSELFAHDQSGARLGLVPGLLQQALLTESFTATVRSCRRQGSKVTELTIRAVASGEQQVPVQLPGKHHTLQVLLGVFTCSEGYEYSLQIAQTCSRSSTRY